MSPSAPEGTAALDYATSVFLRARPRLFGIAYRMRGSSVEAEDVVQEGEPLRVYSAGQSWTEPPNAHHIVSANASKTKPAWLIAYIIADDGAQPTVYDK